jgi:predicted peroxiredoxin
MLNLAVPHSSSDECLGGTGRKPLGVYAAGRDAEGTGRRPSAMGDNEKLVIMVTHGPDDPELATIPFVMAGAAVASDVEVVMGFQGNGVLLMKQGVAETVEAPEFTPLHELLKTVREFGGKLLVCSPCLKSRGLTQADLVEGAEIAAAGRFVAEITSATNSLVY